MKVQLTKYGFNQVLFLKTLSEGNPKCGKFYIDYHKLKKCCLY